MTKKTIPAMPEARPRSNIRFEISARALNTWTPGLRAAAETDADRTIGIFDVIGQDFWTGEGVTVKRIDSALRRMGAGPVTVNMNSPGGDMFEGIAIYNRLREHDGEVTVNVLGIAASAASVITMAGDDVRIARAGFLMIHNAWVLAVGNRHDLRDVADWMEPFDAAMADIYAARTGEDVKSIAKAMDAETWLGGSAAVERGFADELLESDQVASGEAKAHASAVRRVENALRASGMPKSEAMRLLSEFKASVGDPAGRSECDATASESLDTSAIAAAIQSLTKPPR